MKGSLFLDILPFLFLSMLKGKKIILGISGGIAAYKSQTLTRLLVKAGAEVQVILTPNATAFVTEKTLSVLSGKPILKNFFGRNKVWNNHVLLAHQAELLLIAPCTANTLAKMASGICDNLLLAVYLSTKCPIVIAPAMDEDMWNHFTTKKNIETLQHAGYYILPPQKGALASGLEGEGRMMEPEDIFLEVTNQLGKPGRFTGKKVLITAGPTWEEIDPVRYIGNRSSGKMGIAIANQFAKDGAAVDLILGPGNYSPLPSVNCIRIESASEMFEHCTSLFKFCDIAILAAAVADFKAETYQPQKIKKENNNLTITLAPNVDILKELGKLKQNQILVGFALESENLTENAKKKLKAKNLDFIVANTVGEENSGMGKDFNKITIIDDQLVSHPYPAKSKNEISLDISEFTWNYLNKKNP